MGRKTNRCFFFVFTLFLSFSCVALGQSQEAAIPKPPFEMPELVPPRFPAATFSIADYGAVGDGTTANTAAFAKAIAACAKAGGGHVVIPAGKWLTGPIIMASHVDLHAEKGAEVYFSTVRTEYAPSVYAPAKDSRPGLIFAYKCQDIALTGEGHFYGNGEPWWTVELEKKAKEKEAEKAKKEAQAAAKAAAAGAASGAVGASGAVKTGSTTENAQDAQKVGLESKAKPEGEAKAASPQQKPKSSKDHIKITDPATGQEAEIDRPTFVYFTDCKNILIEGPTFHEGPKFMIYPHASENVIIRHITVQSTGPNTDGIDPSACKNVLIEDCNLDTGDDCVAIKSSKGHPTENIVIRNLHMKRGHGLSIGSTIQGGVKNVFAANCDFDGTDAGVRLKSNRASGGVVENCWYQGMKMDNIAKQAIIVDLLYEDKEKKLKPDPATMPVFRNIHIRDLDCNWADQAMILRGLPESPLTGVTLENVTITARKGVIEEDAESPKKVNMTVNATGVKREAGASAAKAVKKGN